MDIQKAIKFCTDEIRRLRYAPMLNGCEMTPEWDEQLEIMETCKNALLELEHREYEVCKATLKKRGI